MINKIDCEKFIFWSDRKQYMVDLPWHKKLSELTLEWRFWSKDKIEYIYFVLYVFYQDLAIYQIGIRLIEMKSLMNSIYEI